MASRDEARGEVERLAALAAYAVLDTPAERAFDDIVLLAGDVCQTPIALVSLVDRCRQWFKARVGLDAEETPREQSFCSHAIQGRDIFQIPDATLDARFAHNPLVTGEPGIRFYAGMPLIARGGQPLGTLCVIDTAARPDGLTALQSRGLMALAAQVVSLLELRREIIERANAEAKLLFAQQVGGFGSFDWPLDQPALDASSAYRDVMGLPPCGAVTAGDVFERIHPRDRPQYVAHLTGSDGSAKSELEFRVVGPDGSIRWVRSVSQTLLDGAGKPIRRVGVAKDIDGQKRSHLAAIEMKERFAFALDGTNEGLWDWNIATGEVWLSDRWFEMFGYERGDIDSDYASWRNLVHPDDRAHAAEAIERYLGADCAQYATEYRVRGKDGSWRWVLDRGKVVSVDAKGRPLRAVGTHADIHQRRIAESRRAFLLELNDRLRGLSEPTALRAAATALLGRWLGVAEAGFAAIDPLRQQFLVHSDWSSGRVPSVAGLWAQSEFDPTLLADLSRGETVAVADVELDPRTSAKSALRFYRSFRTRSVLDVPIVKGGRLVALLFIHHDAPRAWTTDEIELVEEVCRRVWAAIESEEAEARLRESEEHYRYTLELNPQIPWTAAPDGSILEVGPKWLDLTGQSRDETLGAGWVNSLHADDVAPTTGAWLDALASGEPVDVRFRLRGRDGCYRWCRARGAPRRREDGSILRWYGVVEDIHEQVLAEQALRESESKLRIAQDAAGVGVWELDLVSGVATLSPQSLAMYGLPPEADPRFDGIEALSLLIHKDDRKAVLDAVAPAIRSGAVYDVTFRIPVGERLRWVRGVGRAQYDNDGTATRIVGINIDVSRQKEAARRLAQQADLLEQTHDAIFTWEENGGITYWNKAAERLYGYSRAEVLGRTHDDLLLTEQPAASKRSEVGRASNGFWAGQLVHTAKDGRQITVESRHVVVVQDDGRRVVMETNRDVTERVQAEATLRASEERLRLALEVGSMATWDWNIVTGTTIWSEGHYRLFDYEPGETEPGYAAWIARLHPDDLASAEALVQRALTERTPYEAEYRIVRSDGSVAWIEAFGRIQFAADGSAERMIGVLKDVTARKLAEQSLKRAQEDLLRVSRLSAMGAIASTLAHELNQPLTAAHNYISASKRQLENIGIEDGIAYEALDEATAEALRAGEIIRRMRRFTVTGDVNRKRESLERICADAWRGVRQRSQATGVELTADFTIDAVDVDRVQIEQVIANLLRNAVEAMAEAGSTTRRLTVSTRPSPDGRMVELRVEDTGPGLSEAARAHLFEPFKTGKADGTGLGLPLCRTMVEAHGGRIWAEEPTAGGAVFVLSLPAASRSPCGQRRPRSRARQQERRWPAIRPGV